MKIQESNGLDLLDVIAIYWDQAGQTYFLGLTPDHEGPLVYRIDDVEIVDPTISYRTAFFSGVSFPGICHWALVEENLFDAVVDYDPQAIERFLGILRSEETIDW